MNNLTNPVVNKDNVYDVSCFSLQAGMTLQDIFKFLKNTGASFIGVSMDDIRTNRRIIRNNTCSRALGF